MDWRRAENPDVPVEAIKFAFAGGNAAKRRRQSCAGGVAEAVDFATTAPPPAPTLTQLKTSAFSVCGGCHTGGGASLPSSMDLTPAHIYASIVSVASVEQPALKRVKPGDPDNSYVVQKLEGAATITGSRMPLGGPFLDQATIDQVKAWINAGAQNN